MGVIFFYLDFDKEVMGDLGAGHSWSKPSGVRWGRQDAKKLNPTRRVKYCRCMGIEVQQRVERRKFEEKNRGRFTMGV